MASAFLSLLKNLWPFSLRRTDNDLKVSDSLVSRLQIPNQTKQFVFAIHEPKSQAVVYLLAAQNLSEQSALDADYLIKEVQPDAVVALISTSALLEIQMEESHLRDDGESPVPSSIFGVLKGCFINKINSAQYETLAAGQLLRDFFGIGFYGHFLTAKNAAKDVGSTFLLLESPFVATCVDDSQNSVETDLSNVVSSLLPLQSNLLPIKGTSAISPTSRRLLLSDDLQSQLVKSLPSSLASAKSKNSRLYSSDSVHGLEPGECHPRCNFQAPSFAQSVYALLTDLHEIFIDLPGIKKALIYAQKVLEDVDEGKDADTQLLCEVQNFQIAIEGLRIALNNAARSPVNKMENTNPASVEFLVLPAEEKCQALFAQALKCQTKKFKSVVAIVDASCLAGLRKHWNTTVPLEVGEVAEKCFGTYDDDGGGGGGGGGSGGASTDNTDRKRLVADKPVVAFGAGATAVLGVSSLSKALPASTIMKLATYKIPFSLKFGLAQMQRTAAIALAKILGPSKMVAPGIASSSAKTSALKVAASAEKIHAVAHSFIASVERTSFHAMRTAFYEIMRRRGSQPVGVRPWAAFGCSVATFTGLLVYGDGIECVAESVPSAPMIACLGRGLQSLHQASQKVRQTNREKIREEIRSLLYSLRKIRIQQG